MKKSKLCEQISLFLAYPAVLFTVLLYLYPIFLGCSFPKPVATSSAQCLLNSSLSRELSRPQGKAPFRLLALGDPQIEGDTSLPNSEYPLLPHLNALRDHIQYYGFSKESSKTQLDFVKNIFGRDVPYLFWTYRKRLDLWGNDFYLAHIYRTLHWWLQPSHVTVLGDLLGSQWISDEEFARRSSRFWNVVFRGGKRVDDFVTEVGTSETLGQDPDWSRRLINIAGNHDIGYSGDINSHRLERFEDAFGKASWEIKFRLPPQNITSDLSTSATIEPELRVVVLNNMILDSPALDTEYQKQTYEFIGGRVIGNSRPVEDRTAATVVLTHIPLFKRPGVCVDGAFFDFGPNGVKEQNHLSLYSSRVILEGIYGLSGNAEAPAQGLGRNGIILTGHDHEGCDVLHYMPPESERDEDGWTSVKWENSSAILADSKVPSVREITVRSMMGDFGGNAGLLSGWFDNELGEWRFEYATCPLGVQHIWWAVHVLDIIFLLCCAATVFLRIAESAQPKKRLGHGMTVDVSKKGPAASRDGKHVNGHATANPRDSGHSPTQRRRHQK